MQTSIESVFQNQQVKIRSTTKPVTPFGGLVSLIAFFNQIKLAEQLTLLMPFQYQSPNAIPPAQTLLAFMFSIIAGARRLAHTDWLRADKALQAVIGIQRLPGTDTVRNLLKRFTQPQIEAFWRPLWKWLLELAWPMPADGFSIDLDSTVFQRSGRQEGARKGYNPARPGRHSHHPLLAFISEAPLVLHAWLRSGNSSSACGVVAFLMEALALLPKHWKIRTLRADSGFFEDDLLSFLEERNLPYIVVAKMTTNMKRKVTGLRSWQRIDDDYEWTRFELKLQGWSTSRCFFAIRQRIREGKETVGKRLIEVEGYTYRVFVTNREGDGKELWRDYNQRACIEQHIEELKNDLQAEGFCMQNFFATESAFLAVCFTFNLLSLYQHAAAPEQRKAGFRRPGTLRSEVFLGGAVLGKSGRVPVLYIAESWGGLEKHKPLIESILNWQITTSPKLPPPPPEPSDHDQKDEETSQAA